MAISAKDVKALRDRTGAGMMDCKRALEETDGDMEAAIDLLRAKGAAKAAKREDKAANEGTIGTYIHHSGKVGVMVELNCETDFVANTDDFQDLAKDVAMHIAAMAPQYLVRDDVPEDVVANERRLAEETAREEGKPEQAVPRIVDGRVSSFFRDGVLLEQPYAKEPKKTVGQVLDQAGTTVTAFVRFRVGA